MLGTLPYVGQIIFLQYRFESILCRKVTGGKHADYTAFAIKAIQIPLVRVQTALRMVFYLSLGSSNPPKKTWRTDRDSNPGDSLLPTRFPSVRLRPLGHLSLCFAPHYPIIRPNATSPARPRDKKTSNSPRYRLKTPHKPRQPDNPNGRPP